MNKREIRALIRNFVIELIGYGILVVAYVAFAVPWLEKPLARLFDLGSRNGSNLSTYALAGIGVIVVQGLLLDVITSFLVNQLRLERLE